MGKPDQGQVTLNFGTGRGKKPSRSSSLPWEEVNPLGGGTDTGGDEADLRALVVDMRCSLHTIDSKIDTLTDRLDRMGDKLDKHNVRWGHLNSVHWTPRTVPLPTTLG